MAERGSRSWRSRPRRVIAILVGGFLMAGSLLFSGQDPSASAARKKIILDTDIGDDIDDAFALALALQSPELDVLGIVTTHGATDKRARLVARLLGEWGREGIPVVMGVKTSDESPRQYPWAKRPGPRGSIRRNAMGFYGEQFTRYPGEITLIAIGPLTNIGAFIERQGDIFRRVGKVIIMGGSLAYRYDDFGYGEPRGPVAEYNIKTDIPAARKLLRSGVPIIMVGLDATTRLTLDEVKRRILFQRSTPLTDALALLYHLWGGVTPTLYDPMAVAMAVDPSLCRTQPVHVVVDDAGITRLVEGASPNVRVCLDPQVDRFFRLLMTRLL
ncbi:MAG: nucleoside hydrolase, partial [Acidobacteria bacterium]